MTKEQCLEADYMSYPPLGDDFLPLSVVPYPFKDHNQLDSQFTGIDSDTKTILLLILQLIIIAVLDF